MRFASASGIVLAFLAWACASQTGGDSPAPAGEASSTESASEERSAPRGVDLSRERQLVEEARVAAEVMDFATASAKLGEAIDLLLARPESERDAAWIKLMNAAGRVAWDAQDMRAARVAFEGVLEVRSRTLPDDHLDLQMTRGNVANILRMLGDPAAARPIDEKVLEILTRKLPEDHHSLQLARMNLAATLGALGELDASLALEERVFEIFSRTLPDDHPDLQMSRSNLAIALDTRGDLAAARALQERVLEVYARALPDDHPDLQLARNNLASTLYKLGDLAATRALQEKVLDVLSRTLPDDHSHLQLARNNLANTLRVLGDLEAARTLEEKALEVLSRTLPDDHPGLQLARGNLALTLKLLGDVEAARELQEKTLEVLSRTLPEDHPELQIAQNNLAATFLMLGDVQAARALFEQVDEVRSRTLPDDHRDVYTARGNLALAIAAAWDAREGEERKEEEEEEERAEFARLATSFIRAITRSARTSLLTASSREAEERCAADSQQLGYALSFADGLGVFESDPGLERDGFVLSEQTRGAALASAHLSRHASSDRRYTKLREALLAASDVFARLARQGAGADEIDRARSTREAAELDLVRLARKPRGEEVGILEVDPASLSALLSEPDALVGYRRYTRCAHQPGGGSVPEHTQSLCAFVLRSGDLLERIELGPIEPIEHAVSSLRQAVGAGGGRGIGDPRAPPASEEAVLTEGRTLRRLIFDPLLPALEGAERVVVALDDVLHLVPLDALPLEKVDGTHGVAEGSLLGHRWRIETRCTLSELLWNATPSSARETLIAIGGAAFHLPPLEFSAEESDSIDEQHAAPPEVASLLRGGAWEAGFAPLKETGIEARGLADLHGEAFEESRSAIVLEKRKASRAALVELAPRARFLHVATHGWFAPESVRSIADPEPLDAKMGFGSRMSGEERARGMSPMLLCGLALAGASLSEDELGRAPGLITAEEISTLDLTGCELAVLSACDTNVGERRAGQGVASLQKALHMAGARTVITSLWKVPDEATRELMLDFYRRIWIEKKPKGVALWEAKMRIRDAVDERGKPLYSTRDWAAWVLTGEPN